MFLVGYPGADVTWRVPTSDLASLTDQLVHALTLRGYAPLSSTTATTTIFDKDDGQGFTRQVGGGIVVKVSLASTTTGETSALDAGVEVIPNHGCPA